MNYDRLASRWREQHEGSIYGVDQLKRAIAFALYQLALYKREGEPLALDIGCGSSGRFIGVLQEHGFSVEGMDVSEEMIRQARETRPDSEYYVGEISTWKLPKKYDLISAWDSTFHLPVRLQEPALRNMCDGLAEGGILIFTCGGVDESGEIEGSFWGEDFEYGALSLREYLELLAKFGCMIKHMEFDQGPSEEHVYIIAQKRGE